MSAASRGAWSFGLADGLVVPVAPPGVTENERHAIETLILGIGLGSSSADNYIRIWREHEGSLRQGYSLGTMSAYAERIAADKVMIRGMYGQFNDCRIPADEFEEIMVGLADFLRALE